MTEYYLHIPDASERKCELWEVSEQNVKLRIYKPFQRGSIWLILHNVQYMDCPISWKGASFYVSDDQEAVAKLLAHSNHPGDKSGAFKIYSVTGKSYADKTQEVVFVAERNTIKSQTRA